MTSPEEGDISAPAIWSSVVLPDPDGPVTTMSSPRPISRSMPESARTAASP
jgi:hypothetical protein